MSPSDPAAPATSAATSPEPEKKNKKALWIILAVIIVLALIAGVFFFMKGSSDNSSEDGEVFLEAAASQGIDSFSDGPLADQPDPAIAQAATEQAPNVTGSVQSVSSTGSTPGLYGGSSSQAICDTARMLKFFKSNPDKAQAWVDALNADPDLRWSGGQVTTATIPAYIKGLTPIILVQDTRVTNHGYQNGKATQFQSVLQRGSGIFVDEYGIPRVRCFCGNPLLAPKASKGTPKYQGKAWPGFNPSKVGVVVSAPKPQTSFKVRIPATPKGQISTVKVGPKCAGGVPCPSSLFNTAAPSPSATATSAAPTSAAPTSAAPTYSPKLEMIVAKFLPNGDTDYAIGLTGYKPGSKVSLTCGSAKQPNFYTTTVTITANGTYHKNPFCYSPDKGVFVRDNTNGITAWP